MILITQRRMLPARRGGARRERQVVGCRIILLSKKGRKIACRSRKMPRAAKLKFTGSD
jgi:hypothetical protein